MKGNENEISGMNLLDLNLNRLRVVLFREITIGNRTTTKQLRADLVACLQLDIRLM